MNTPKALFSSLLLGFAVTLGCTGIEASRGQSNPVSHEKFTSLLTKHVDEDGMVNYQGFIADSILLNSYLTLLENAHPNDERWSRDEQLAYWINAYNAFTIRLIVRNYPVQSIKDLGGSLYRVNTPWDIKFIRIEGNQYHLNNIEHDIIRKKFDEPRIHFALVCAAKSCPRLRREAYTAQKLHAQLNDQAKHFFNSPSRNMVNSKAPKLSKLMDWYSGDFRKNAESIGAYVNRYSTVQIEKDAHITYMPYDWGLNEQQ